MRTAFPVQELPVRSALTVAANCVNRTRKHAASVTAYSVLRACPSIQRSTRKPPQQTTGNVESEKGLRIRDVQVFFQSVKVISSSRISCNRWSRRSWSAAAPPSLLCICVRFASLISAISSRSFLIRSDTNFGINSLILRKAGTHSQRKLPNVQFGFALLSAQLLEIY